MGGDGKYHKKAGGNGSGNGGGDDGVQKTFVITGIPGYVFVHGGAGGGVGIFPTSTSDEDAFQQQEKGVVAAADLENDGKITEENAAYTLSLLLYADGIRWTGTGTYNVYVMLNGGGGHYYKASNVTFSQATTTISFSAATEIYPLGGGGPATPTGVKAEALSPYSILISWNHVPVADGYWVYRSTSSSGEYSLIAARSSMYAYYEDTELSPNTTYYYKVSAYHNTYGESPLSVFTSATTSGE
jgi:hypothetical protein